MENLQFADSLRMLMNGFAIALQPTNLMFAFIGCLVGTLVGVLPGVGPVTGVAILIPLTFVLDPIPAIIMLAAIYYGTAYGGTITSVLVNVPGEAASAVTCLEGHEMAKQGRAGPALAIAAIGSFVGGTFATIVLVLLALPLTAITLKFGPPEFFCLVLLGLSLVSGLASTSMVRGLMSAVLGLMISLIGIDPMSGGPRFTFGQLPLLDGFGIVPIAMGLFGIGDILVNAERGVIAIPGKLGSLMLSMRDLRTSAMPIVRGTLIGTFLGFIPGVGSAIPAFMSYALEKKLSRTPEKFGTGMIEGVAAPETSNNAYCNAAFVPLFTLGIPSSAAIAVLMGAFMINGMIPGPFLLRDHADLVWAIVASMYIGNVVLLILNLPLIPLWVAVLRIPYSLLFSLVLAFCVVGAYADKQAVFDIGAMAGFGLLGYVCLKLDYPLAPMILTLILGPMMEKSLRQSLDMSQGDFSIFLTRPVSAVLLVIVAFVVISTMLGVARQVRGADAET